MPSLGISRPPVADSGTIVTNRNLDPPVLVDHLDSCLGGSLKKILVIWASVTAPMALLAFVVAPAIVPHTSVHPRLVHWMLMVVGMMWQFVVSIVILRRELGGLHWPTIKERIWLNLPRDPRTGKARKILFLWAVPAIAANVLGGFLATRLDTAWTNLLPALRELRTCASRGWSIHSSKVNGGSWA